MAALFSAAIGTVLVAWTVRRARASAERRALAAQPARSADTALRVERFDEIDRAVRKARCRCGGGLNVLSEGSRELEGEHLRVVHCECLRCEEEQDLFFRAPALH